MSTIVVGVDGSAGARAALDFALDEARLRATDVRVVAAWQLPAVAYAGGYGLGDVQLLSELEQDAGDHAARALEDADAGGVEVSTVVREGTPAQVLLEEADGADLLVVGTRGLGGFRGLLLGSVSQQCAHHAPCPLVIVPPPRDL
ncbi:MAG TPA: universal stress protein [Solirubrobacteraceae bacterium]|nr:universal stress protein [Solirubrobacteraceae bacterium]